jgi:MoaA/NifB/PqqE/SkfB family radical SAM enzyme
MYKVTSRWGHQDSLSVQWNLGKRCNYDCSYCPDSIHDNFSKHTDIQILKDTVDKICETDKPVRITFTGGEPTVHPKFEELLHYLKAKDVSWVSLTTNGTRTHAWHLENEEYWNHILFSLHYESDYLRIIDTILEYKKQGKKNFFVNVMAHHDYMEAVRKTVELFDANKVKYAVRRIRWGDEDHDEFDDDKYIKDDLGWLLELNATADANCLVDDEEIVHANDIIKQHRNKFTDWKCNIGLESLMINWDGEVHRATCRVGGSLGNIYQGTFAHPTQSVICNRNWCTCAADIFITKVKS